MVLRSRPRWLRWVGAVVLVGALVPVLCTRRPVDDASWSGEARESSLAALEQAWREQRAGDAEVAGRPLWAGVARVSLEREGHDGVALGGNPGLVLRRRADGAFPESVWARALAVRQGSRRAVLLNLDVLAVHPGLARAILDRCRTPELRPQELMLVATHTHSGPGQYWDGWIQQITLGAFDEGWLEHLAARGARAIDEAFEGAAEVALSHAALDLPGGLRNRVSGRDEINPALNVWRLAARDDSFVAEVWNYSAHPTCRVHEPPALSGDYPGVLAHRVETERPRRRLLFTPGTIGDMGPPRAPGGGEEAAERMADRLQAAWSRLEFEAIDRPLLRRFEFALRMPPVQARVHHSGWLGSWYLRDLWARRLLPESLQATTVQVLALGPCVLLGAPIDLNSSIGRPLLQRGRELGLRPAFVSMADDWVGYVMTEDEYDSGNKSHSQLHGPHTGEMFTEIYLALLQRLSAAR